MNKDDKFILETEEMDREEFEREIAMSNRMMAENDRRFTIISIIIAVVVATLLISGFIFASKYSKRNKANISEINRYSPAVTTDLPNNLFGIMDDVERDGAVVNVKFNGNESAADRKNKMQSAYDQIMKVVPNVYFIDYLAVRKDTNSSVFSVAFEGPSVDGRNTLVFAYLAFPNTVESTSNLPAVVLVHDNGGHASATWAAKWAEKGFVAISFDTGGYFLSNKQEWERALPDCLDREKYTVSPQPNYRAARDKMNYVDKSWIYHATATSSMAYNLLKKCSAVNPDKIGIVGISVGSVAAMETVSYDSRFSFGVMIYGGAYLDENLGVFKDFKTKDNQILWSAQDRMDNVKIPIYWLSGNKDNYFSLNVNTKSYLKSLKNNPDCILTIDSSLIHNQSAAIKNNYQYTFARKIVGDEDIDLKIKTFPTGRNPVVKLKTVSDADVSSATIYYSTTPLKYGRNSPSYNLLTATCTIGDNNVSGKVPANAKFYYIEIKYVVGDSLYCISTPVVNL